jgi:AraC-like DNA-binding protein
MAGLSRFHFLRAFRSAFDKTPHAYATHLRLERAKELLAAGEQAVTEICFEVGFSSLGSFSSLFSSKVGESPSAYRRRLNRIFQVPDWLVDPTVPLCFIARYLP